MTRQEVKDVVVFGWTVIMIAAALGAACSTLGCGSPEADPSSGFDLTALAPSAELLDATERAAADLDRHLGTGSRVAEGGIPVRYESTPADYEAVHCSPDHDYAGIDEGCTAQSPRKVGSCAATIVSFYGSTGRLFDVYVLLARPMPEWCPRDPATTLEHEAIHVLRAQVTADKAASGHAPDVQEHSAHGLFQAAVGPEGDVLEETSAVMACESGLCTLIDL